MKKNILITLLAALLLSSCGEYNKLLKSTDYEYKYEAAKNYFAKGQYNRAATLLNELIAILKGTDKAEESLYMLGMSYYNQKDYQTAAQTFIQYYNVYPRGTFTELARFHAGKALYLDTPEPRLDQSGTYSAIQQLQIYGILPAKFQERGGAEHDICLAGQAGDEGVSVCKTLL